MKFFIQIFFVATTVGLFFGYIDPTYDDVKIRMAEEQNFNEALDKSKELQIVRDKLLSRYNSFSTSDLNKLEKLLPDNVDNIRLTLDIDNIASAYGMRIRNVAVSQSSVASGSTIGPSDKPYETVTLSFSVIAPYEEVLRFLKDLERSLRIVDVAKLSLIASTGSLYEYQISIETYWLK
ncbi:type 4a pilus biogenesis protein PilO [Patescibacteria group bacterium]|nr:type 4a pilus biogenesis protein PilO [Patescibacteria group bacterium]